MRSVDPDSETLKRFPLGTVMVHVGPPPGMEDSVNTIKGYKTEGEVPYYFFIYEFENHEEWKDFQKTRKLVLGFLGSVIPHNIGALNPKTLQEGDDGKEGKENLQVELKEPTDEELN